MLSWNLEPFFFLLSERNLKRIVLSICFSVSVIEGAGKPSHCGKLPSSFPGNYIISISASSHHRFELCLSAFVLYIDSFCVWVSKMSPKVSKRPKRPLMGVTLIKIFPSWWTRQSHCVCVYWSLGLETLLFFSILINGNYFFTLCSFSMHKNTLLSDSEGNQC